MIRLARHQEAEEQEHPSTASSASRRTRRSTTDIHLPRRIGEAIKHAFYGDIEDDFEKDGYFVRVAWTRET
jgi:hypothetical protein